MNNELIDRHLDAILSASGSALRNYSMQKTIDDMRSSLMAAINDSALTQQQEAEPVERATFNAVEHELATIQSTVSSFESPAKAVAALIDWHAQVALDPKVNGQQDAEPVAYRHEILEPGDDRAFVMHSESAENPWGHWMASYLGECVYRADPLFLHPPKPAARPVAGHLDDTRNFLSRHLNEINKAEDGDRDHDLERHLEIALSAMSAAQPQVPDGCLSDSEVREALVAFMKDTEALPLQECVKRQVMRIKRLLSAAKEEGK